ncbi:uncharacterized protein LOC129693688 isoform X3 [Leucoraja erinacea]|uniref:uncharacterized protein LOC129693688 isoform X3 n=1 Tax=Leucoraja erinaceus TaxID=7782 RepID=UPI002455BF46|nr:uncharacterized protein LOC129693688 isoform X3 [Leucoraja erinacea]
MDRRQLSVLFLSLLAVAGEAEPLTVVALRRHITAEIRAKVLLSVRVTGAVKNGTWWYNGWPLVRWNETNINDTRDAFWDNHLFPNYSLLLVPSFVDRDDDFTITVSSQTGEEASANISLSVYATKETCDIYNGVLGLLILLTLAFILFFVVFTHKNRPNDYMETFEMDFVVS